MVAEPSLTGAPVVRVPDQRLRVHLSTSPDDLQAEREAARAAIEELRLRPVGADDALSHGGSPPRVDADVFVGVYGERYGHIDPVTGLSRLEQEYLASGDRPRLIYVREPAPDRDPHLTVLLARIQADDRASYRRVRSTEELRERVADDLALLLTERFTEPAAPPPPPPPLPEPAPVSRLPRPATTLLGREEAVADVLRLLEEGHRLVTLSGPGGIGKTRLAIAVAAALAESVHDGVWLVDLSGVRDPSLVAPTIAHALDVRESAGASPFAALKDYLAPRHTVLVLDSFEAVAAAGPLLTDLLGAAPALRLVITSRTILRVRGEQEYPVPPLAVPPGPVADPGPWGSVALFLDRARAVNPLLDTGPEELAAVVEICRRLDGVPLAIELAAARARILTPTALLGRLTSRLDVLTGGPRDLPARQRTMRDTIDWDHDLLGLEEQVLFRRLAVFVRGWTITGAEAVVGDTGADLIDGLDSLVGKSLIRRLEPTPSGEPRFGMLQALREYGLERLADSGELEALHRRHAEYHLGLAEHANEELHGPQQAACLSRLELAHEDLRAALRWSDEHVEIAVLLRLAAALGGFWRIRCHFTEGRRWLERALSLSVGYRDATRVAILEGAGFLARARGSHDTAETLYEEALGIRRELGDQPSTSLRLLGAVAYERDDLERSRELFHEAMQALADEGDEVGLRSLRNNLGVVAWLLGDLDDARQHFEAALPSAIEQGDDEQVARVRMNLAAVLTQAGDGPEAVPLARAAVQGFHALEDTWDMVDALETLAAAEGSLDTRRSGWIYGAAESLRDALGAPRPPGEQTPYDANVRRSREPDPDTFDQARQEGRTASVAEIIAFAIGPGVASP